MTNSLWVISLYVFARQSHRSCLIQWPTGSEWNGFISFLCSLINHVSSHDQQQVSDTGPFASLSGSLINHVSSHNSLWVTLVYFFATHQSWFIPCPIASEWPCFISSLINHVSSHDQQFVSNIALCLCQVASSAMSLQMVCGAAYFLCLPVHYPMTPTDRL